MENKESRLKRFFVNLFTKNIIVKIIAIIVAGVIWALISNAQDPVITRNLNIPITYENNYILFLNEELIVVDSPETVTIQVSFHQSKSRQVTPSLFTCTADVSDHSGGVLSSQRVHVNVQQVGGTDVVVSWNYQRNDPNITVVMDQYIQKAFKVELLAEDSLAEDLILEDSLSFTPSEVIVGGPSESFGSLSSVKAVVSLQDLSEYGGGVIEKEVPIGLYDANDQLISNDSGTFDVAVETVTLTATISRRQTVNIRVAGVKGEPASGYRYLSCTVEPENLGVRGPKSVLADLTEIFIPEDVIDISGISEDHVYTVDISPYLPDGVSLESDNSFVSVRVSVEAVTERTMVIPRENIALSGRNSDYEYEIRTPSVSLLVKGFKEDLDVLTISTLAPEVNVSGLAPGTYYLPLKITEPSGYIFENDKDVYVYVNVTGDEPETEETKPTETEETKPTETKETDSTSESKTESSEEASDETEPSEQGGEDEEP